MFSGLYTLSVVAYRALLQLASPFNAKARLWVEGRRGWADWLTQRLAQAPDRPTVWFHAASLGEFEQGRPVMEAFREHYPAYQIVLTFFSPSGYEVRKNYVGADHILYLPIDTPENARRFVGLVKPRLAFFIKYEFWPSYLRELNKVGVPVVSFSAIFRPNQLFFKSYGGPYRALLHAFQHILVQNQESLDLLRSIGVTNVTLAGDTRFDRVAQVAAARKTIPLAAAFKAGQPLLVIGSAWPADMDVLIPFLNAFTQPLKLIVAPHDIHDATIERWREQLNKPSVRFSQADEAGVKAADVLFIDNVGMLSSLYQYGEFAYVGGAFGKGLHNILEAATFGMPLFFGPNYVKFQEAVDLIELGAAFPIQTTGDFAVAFQRQYADRSEAARISRDYVLRNIGATATVMNVAAELISENASR